MTEKGLPVSPLNGCLLTGFLLLIFGIRIDLIGSFASIVPYWDAWSLGHLMLQHEVQSLDWQTLTQPANEHRLFFSRILQLGLFELNEQQWDGIVVMVVDALIWSLTAWFLCRIILVNQKLASQSQRICMAVFVVLVWAFPTALVNILWSAQTLNYMMILLVLTGVWLSLARAFSREWLLGLALLFCACFTMAGGSLAAMSVCVATILQCVAQRSADKAKITTIAVTLVIALIAVFFIHESTGAMRGRNLTNAWDFVNSIAKTLSWPLSTKAWPALIFALPPTLLTWKLLISKSNDTDKDRLAWFAVSLFGFASILAIGVAFARGNPEFGPMRRYYEFLNLYGLSSFISLVLLMNHRFRVAYTFKASLVITWLSLFLTAIPFQVGVVTGTLAEREKTRPYQEHFVRHYLAHSNIDYLQGQPFLHVPYPFIDRLGDLLDRMRKVNMLHYQLQPEAELTNTIQDSAFIKDGVSTVYSDSEQKRYHYERAYGSFNLNQGGQNATGIFESSPLEYSRDRLAIPVLGFFGYPGLELKLIELNSGKETTVPPGKALNSNAELWRYVYVETPKGPFKLVANDANSDLWFGFAAPRSVGRLTYYVETMLNYRDWIWKLGIILSVFGLRRPIIRLLTDSA